MKKIAIVFILVTTTAFYPTIRKPPPEYSGPYTGKLTERLVPLVEIGGACSALGTKTLYAWGCAQRRDGACLIFLPAIGPGVTSALQEQIRAHELAHCNGWPNDHPGWR